MPNPTERIAGAAQTVAVLRQIADRQAARDGQGPADDPWNPVLVFWNAAAPEHFCARRAKGDVSDLVPG